MFFFIIPALWRRGLSLTACNAAPNAKSKMLVRGPKMAEWGLERDLPPSFWALTSTLLNKFFSSEEPFYEKRLWRREKKRRRRRRRKRKKKKIGENSSPQMSLPVTRLIDDQLQWRRSCQLLNSSLSPQTWSRIYHKGFVHIFYDFWIQNFVCPFLKFLDQ